MNYSYNPDQPDFDPDKCMLLVRQPFFYLVTTSDQKCVSKLDIIKNQKKVLL